MTHTRIAVSLKIMNKNMTFFAYRSALAQMMNTGDQGIISAYNKTHLLFRRLHKRLADHREQKKELQEGLGQHVPLMQQPDGQTSQRATTAQQECFTKPLFSLNAV